MPVHVTSEIGALRTVLVHSPGNELLAVTPSTREDFLYDDIIDADLAKREHRRFVQVLERFCEVLHVRDLLAEVLEDHEVRELIIRETLDIVPLEPLALELRELPPKAVVNLLIEGKEEAPGPLSRTLNEFGYALPPLPNLFFTRDSAMAINQHMMIGSMRFHARWTEELIMKALFTSHPQARQQGHPLRRLGASGGSTTRSRAATSTRCGEDVLLIGFSERSSPAAIDSLASLLFEQTEVTNIIVVVMPQENDGDPPRHDLHAGRPRAVRGLSAALHRTRSPADPSLAERRAARCRSNLICSRRSSIAVCRWSRSLRRVEANRPGSRAVGLGLQLRGAAPRRRHIVRAKRDNTARIGESGLQDRSRRRIFCRRNTTFPRTSGPRSRSRAGSWCAAAVGRTA